MNAAKGIILTKGSRVSDTPFSTLGSLCSVCRVYSIIPLWSIHIGVYPMALEEEFTRHIHLVADFIDFTHVVLGCQLHLDGPVRKPAS